MDSIAEFCFSLRKKRNSYTVFNPYRDVFMAANLETYLRAIKAQGKAPLLLVGEAPGYLGCIHTGIPFSSASVLKVSTYPFIDQLRKGLVIKTSTSETTAEIVWRYLQSVDVVPLFWNAFPFHPHLARKFKTNRGPTKAEIVEGSNYLYQLAAIFKPLTIAGIGRAGQQCARLVFPDRDIAYIRHPSRGGKMAFIEGMNRLLAEKPLGE